MNIILKLWLVWIGLSAVAGVVSITFSDAFNIEHYNPRHWSNRLGNAAFMSFSFAVCAGIIGALLVAVAQ